MVAVMAVVASAMRRNLPEGVRREVSSRVRRSLAVESDIEETGGEDGGPRERSQAVACRRCA